MLKAHKAVFIYAQNNLNFELFVPFQVTISKLDVAMDLFGSFLPIGSSTIREKVKKAL
jgi:hypothetical protein